MRRSGKGDAVKQKGVSHKQSQDPQVQCVDRQQHHHRKHTGQRCSVEPEGRLYRGSGAQNGMDQQQKGRPDEDHRQRSSDDPAPQADDRIQIGVVVGDQVGRGGGGIDQDALHPGHQGKDGTVQRQGQNTQLAFYHGVLLWSSCDSISITGLTADVQRMQSREKESRGDPGRSPGISVDWSRKNQERYLHSWFLCFGVIADRRCSHPPWW